MVNLKKFICSIMILSLLLIGLAIIYVYPLVFSTESSVNLKPASDSISYSSDTYFYKYNLYNKNGVIKFITYEKPYLNFSNEAHMYLYNKNDIIMELLYNNEQDDYIETLLDDVRLQTDNPDEQAKIIISMVQHIPFDYQNTRMSDWYYPYETLHLNRGVCSDKSILLAYLLNKLDYDVVLFRYKDENHMAVGVKSHPEYDYRDSGYAFIETTQTSIITDVPDTFTNGKPLVSNPEIVKIHGGFKTLDVSEEYNDASRLNYLESIGSKNNAILSSHDYNEWYSISTKYDLFYEDNKV